ncbi:hypothetical protein GGI25_002213 [Coemansia spiralis]|uniref:tRNA pseudouridine(55) synthase n=2 Tax=Coemansia TaxID=4863 RepID=A0A9W8KZA8_9FUNG|nr:hypothetical protein BX070DRAFT_221721 [Coemansia spiralis]KAJ1996223.1 hypothetical protein EDC05_000113 [Coemansia umbellata]KAJ2626021.1 hypothetical protein GGI26_000105 [Coemansia sp. RSA 1358]KAJ2678625.1 hypothetical protein GGI25_002213 [Coemansia spiralis]
MADTVESAVMAVLQSGNSKYADAGQIKEASEKLYSFGLCALCILRYIQLPIGPSYCVRSADAIYKALGIEAKQDQKPDEESLCVKPCPACLGILDLTVADHIVGQFKAEDYDTMDALVGIELPKSIYIRHRAVQIAGRQQNIPSAAENVPEVKDVFRYLFTQQLSIVCDVKANATNDMRIDIAFSHPETATEHQFLNIRKKEPASNSSDRKNGTFKASADRSKTVVLSDLGACADDEFTKHSTCPPPAIETAAKIDSLIFKRASLFIGGRYLKLERNISQTPFVVEGRRMTELSVAEVIGEPLERLIRCDSYNLVGSGREDADVRMLGDGRPFYIECINPRFKAVTKEQIQDIEDQLTSSNSPVQVRRLQVIPAKDTSIIKEGEEHKTKHYCALVWFSQPLNPDKLVEINTLGKNGILLQQKTPVRVLHRRAPLTRPKRLLNVELSHIEDRFYKVRIESEAGAYIKEFVHGDLGRTTPSLADLAGVTADILELDVEGVSLDFPPTPKDTIV